MTLTDELIQLADETANVLARMRNDSLKQPLAALREACDEAKRAWSGSNIGYHATVYYQGLQPKPPGVEFSPEWGMLDRWPTHQPDEGWVEMDDQTVTSMILARAGNPDIEAIEQALSSFGEELSSAKERAISLLIAAQQIRKDVFIDRKLKQIEPLFVATRDTIAPTLVRANDWSRDSLAVTQGTRIAPHQSLIALPLSATVVGNGLNTLERAVRDAALHLERIDQGKRKMTATGKTIFIGHGRSPVWRELKEFIKERLRLGVEEFNSVPVAGISVTNRLEEMLDGAAFACLLMTAEDEQPDGKFHARLNVIHEAGLFQGRLGFRKAIIVLEDTCEEFSNIHGLNQIRFSKDNISAKFEEIRLVLEREGLISAH